MKRDGEKRFSCVGPEFRGEVRALLFSRRGAWGLSPTRGTAASSSARRLGVFGAEPPDWFTPAHDSDEFARNTYTDAELPQTFKYDDMWVHILSVALVTGVTGRQAQSCSGK